MDNKANINGSRNKDDINILSRACARVCVRVCACARMRLLFMFSSGQGSQKFGLV